MIKQLSRNLFKALAIVLCVSLSANYIALAAPLAKMKASVDAPKLRSAYSNPNNIKLEGDVSLSRGKQIISVSLRDSDVKQALRMFADRAGLNIIFHNSVSGKITLDLVNVTLNDAFKMIMQMSELTYVIDNDTIMVMSSEASKNINVSKENMSIIPVKYVDAAAIAHFLNVNIFNINKPGLSNDEIVVTNPIKNELLVFGTDNDYKMAKKIVEKLDTKPTVTTFKVNHTTPKEMATLLCDTLFAIPGKGANAGGEGSSAGTSGAGGATPTGGTTTGGGSATGAATPTDTSSSSGGIGSGGTSSSMGMGSTGTSTSGGKDLILGGAVVACTLSSNAKTDKLTSLANNSLSIAYKPALGVVSMIGGTPEQIAMVNDFITTNDKKQPQAFIEFSIVELNEAGSKEFNNSWQIASNAFSASFGSEGFMTGANNPIFWSGNKIGSTAFTKYSGPFAVTQNISYLIKNGKGRTLANPKVMVTNGKMSTIDLTSDYIKSVDSQVVSGSSALTNAIQKTYTIGKDNGLKIELTPFISPDGYVSMNLKPQYATIKDPVKDLASDGKTLVIVATLLQRRNLDLSNVRIKDGETLVLAGLVREEETQKVTKLPVLGDLPYIGTFFRNSSKSTERSELVIMITPRIVVDTEDVTRL